MSSAFWEEEEVSSKAYKTINASSQFPHHPIEHKNRAAIPPIEKQLRPLRWGYTVKTTGEYLHPRSTKGSRTGFTSRSFHLVIFVVASSRRHQTQKLQRHWRTPGPGQTQALNNNKKVPMDAKIVWDCKELRRERAKMSGHKMSKRCDDKYDKNTTIIAKNPRRTLPPSNAPYSTPSKN